MAILQRYRKVREADREVEYVFGFPETDRHLTISKVERSYEVADPLVLQTCECAMHWAAQRAVHWLPRPNLGDPFEPLIVMYEHGGEFTIEHGFVQVDAAGIRRGEMADHLRPDPIIELDTAVLDRPDSPAGTRLQTEGDPLDEWVETAYGRDRHDVERVARHRLADWNIDVAQLTDTELRMDVGRTDDGGYLRIAVRQTVVDAAQRDKATAPELDGQPVHVELSLLGLEGGSEHITLQVGGPVPGRRGHLAGDRHRGCRGLRLRGPDRPERLS